MMKKMHYRIATVAAWLAVASAPALAATDVANAWVRGTVPGQPASGAFMQITSAEGGRLVGVSSPWAGMAEIHEMKTVDGVMKMNAVPFLELPAGKSVELKPGGYHVMLMGLKQQLKGGEQLPLVLTIETAGGKKETLELKLPIKALGQ
ncbi:copper chaperone PCu(A)C [Ideonella sp. DXS29W]|uniref:Copper chaperone PCu(A)C n=1 Tax=Ideonella lacteola TaxID=2984193 RepID=A0ABU9BLK9_9BURK